MSLITPQTSNMSPNDVEQAKLQAEQAAFLKILRDADDMECESCKGVNFIQVTRLKKISGLITGTGKDSLIPIPVYACADCGHVNSVFLAKIDNTPTQQDIVKP